MSTSDSPTNPASKACEENAIATQGSLPNASDEGSSALEYAQRQLFIAHEALEQVLDVMRRADDKKLKSFLAATQSGLSQPEILELVRQYAKDMDDSAPK